MKWKDRSGKEVSGKEFMQRWKEGIQEITPLQQASATYKNTWMIIIGIIGGFGYSVYRIADLWWLALILGAALMNTIIVQIGNYQKVTALKKMEESLNSIDGI